MKPTIENLSACLISIALAGCGGSDSSPVDPLPESAGAQHAAPANTGHTETSVTPASNQSVAHSQGGVTSSPVETSTEQPDAEPASPLAEFEGHGFTVLTPAGYQWEFLQSLDNQGLKGALYKCSNPDSPKTNMVLVIEDMTRPTDGHRSGGFKGHYNGAIESLKRQGFKIVGYKRPELTTPIPERLDFSITAQGADGSNTYAHFHSYFGQKTYLFQAFSPSESDGAKVVEVGATLNETLSTESAR
jgi:hypothetical protein